MRRALSLLIAALIAVVPATAAGVRPATRQPADSVSLPGPAERQLIQRYCVTCHNQKLKTAGLMLDTLGRDRCEHGPPRHGKRSSGSCAPA